MSEEQSRDGATTDAAQPINAPENIAASDRHELVKKGCLAAACGAVAGACRALAAWAVNIWLEGGGH
ncbi:hypothetical protein [Streptomyces sp. NPDC021562]|uniref:hypothetical protein n=1 Tax=Streptomyces sp. NPDC021562 TaxID=3155121 RepID=UPI0033FD266C